jgi:hypothetical protein
MRIVIASLLCLAACAPAPQDSSERSAESACGNVTCGARESCCNGVCQPAGVACVAPNPGADGGTNNPGPGPCNSGVCRSDGGATNPGPCATPGACGSDGGNNIPPNPCANGKCGDGGTAATDGGGVCGNGILCIIGEACCNGACQPAGQPCAPPPGATCSNTTPCPAQLDCCRGKCIPSGLACP